MDDDTTHEPAAEVMFGPQWAFKLGSRDALLMLRALGGRLSDEDAAEALLLCDRLTALRHRAGAALVESLERANGHMEAARESRGLDPDPIGGRSAARRVARAAAKGPR